MALDRRTFIRDMGRGVLGIAVGGVALSACSDAVDAPATSLSGSSAITASDGSAPTTFGAGARSTTTDPPPSATHAGDLDAVRVDLGFVSAWLMVRGTEVAIVDTGVSGSADQIEATLSEVGLGWGDVGNVIVTHRHGDHAGSLSAVADAAVEAVLGTGAGELEAIPAPRPLEGYTDGQTVFGLWIIDTPGHTPGHISIWDPDTAVLVAGDALNGGDSGVTPAVDGVGGPNPQFTPDMETAIASARRLAELRPDTILFGHGSPKRGAAGAALTALLERL